MTIKTQNDLYTHLQSLGLDPADALLGSMLDITYLIPTFLEKGGTYTKPERNEYPMVSISSPRYPTALMKVSYGTNWFLLSREIREGYPVIQLVERGDVWWSLILVHPDHLDTALCYLLEVT